jgi:hypothetical protein
MPYKNTVSADYSTHNHHETSMEPPLGLLKDHILVVLGR